MLRQFTVKWLMVFLCPLLSLHDGYSQSNIYQRSSVSYGLVGNMIPSELKTQMNGEWTGKSQVVATRFDLNKISTRILSPTEVTDSKIHQAIRDQKIGNQLIGFWWARSTDGTFSIDTVAKRGRYNATDGDVMAANSSAIGDAKMYDVGEQMIAKSFYLVGAIKSFSTYEEYYDGIDDKRRATARENKTDFEPIERVYRGYFAKMDAYMFQLDFSDSIRTLFYENLWISPGDSEELITERKAAFDAFDFPLTQVSKSSNNSIYGREKRNRTDRNGNPIPPSPMSTLFSSLISSAKSKVDEKLLSDDRFNIKTTLFATDPIQAKIGTKEGLHIDTRYFVYEFKENFKGERKRVRKAVIRARSVSKNKGLASGSTETSEFYMITGRPLDPGMLLEEHDDKGLAFSGYGGSTEIGGGGARVDLLVSKFGQSGQPGWNLTAFLESESDEYFTPPVAETDFSFFRIGGGVRKDFYFIPFVRVGVGLEGGLESADYADNPSDEGYVQAIFVRPNIEAGVHVWHNIQIIMNIHSHGYLNPTYANEDEIDVKWSEFFEDRKGPTLFFGARFNL